jgi:hypothetical protein
MFFTLSLVLIYGSVLSLTDLNMAFAIDMSDAPATQDTITAGPDGDDEDQGDNDQEDAPVTQDTITAGESRDDNDEDNSGQNNNDNNDNELATEIKDAPNCPGDQERALFDDACMPTAQVNDCGNGIYPLPVWCQNTASQIQGDENSAALAGEQTVE